ncbi:hydrolase [Pontibacter diazotrophicus]|uniref:Hydrolase n=1 Tax=Pontibacter diazotrophicus TaxID=1400979 RepID=A0A3D8LFP4_9BACT|nr:MBL fold metallo-hydrolase [Pontibacter diazotrophicus]RDV16269.1 hydrolase [Pontibacter diazotrophicus]
MRRPQQAAASRYENGKFLNTSLTKVLQKENMLNTLQRYAKRSKGAAKPPFKVPVHYLASADFEREPSEQLRVNWLGHASLILELGKRRYLIDPVLSERASPVPFAGPKRIHPAPLTAVDIHNVDAVIISHDHYDHLDYHTIHALRDKVPLFYVPLKVKKLLVDWGVPPLNIVELDWWQQVQDGDNLLVATPARHFSGRWLFDRNSTLWVSWCIVGKNERVFYSGDSGPMQEFTDIGAAYGPFDLTIMPIGAYDVNWADIHTNSEEAVQAHHQVQGKRLLPVHWATFDLAIHRWGEPIERLHQAAALQGVPILVPEVGQWVNNASSFISRVWWKGR